MDGFPVIFVMLGRSSFRAVTLILYCFAGSFEEIPAQATESRLFHTS